MPIQGPQLVIGPEGKSAGTNGFILRSTMARKYFRRPFGLLKCRSLFTSKSENVCMAPDGNFDYIS